MRGIIDGQQGQATLTLRSCVVPGTGKYTVQLGVAPTARHNQKARHDGAWAAIGRTVAIDDEDRLGSTVACEGPMSQQRPGAQVR